MLPFPAYNSKHGFSTFFNSDSYENKLSQHHSGSSNILHHMSLLGEARVYQQLNSFSIERKGKEAFVLSFSLA
jgi:hypothetical protein